MSFIDDLLFECQFVGMLYFLPSSSNSSAICQLEFGTLGPAKVARISLSDKEYEISDELLFCPDKEQRFLSRRDIVPCGTGPRVQLLLVKDRLTPVTFDDRPHLRVVGDWIARTEDKNGRVRTTRWGFEGLLKQSSRKSARLEPEEANDLRKLHMNWREVSE